jgi:hypothetical protein
VVQGCFLNYFGGDIKNHLYSGIGYVTPGHQNKDQAGVILK